MSKVKQTLAALAARTALVVFTALVWVLAPSVGWLALYGHGDSAAWTARFVMVGLLFGVWLSTFANFAVREWVRRGELRALLARN